MGLIVEGAVLGCPLGQVAREGRLWASVALLICGHTWPQRNRSPHLQKTGLGLPLSVPESGPLLRADGSGHRSQVPVLLLITNTDGGAPTAAMAL